ncbi:MAG: glycosyltransferase family 2 protein, partial [Acidimicrobiales bacterium]
EDGDRWWRMQTAAYHAVRHDIRLRDGVERLVAVAADLAATQPVPLADDPFFTQPQPTPASLKFFAETARPVSLTGGDVDSASLRQAAKSLKLDMLDLRRQIHRLELTLATGKQPLPVEFARTTHAHLGAKPRISILMALYNYDEHVRDALDSLLASDEECWEVIIVDDGSTDRSQTATRDWMREHEDRSALLLHHPVNRGLAHARNAALAWARGEYCFVLDADNEIYPHCLTRLLQAAESDPEAAFSYGIFERFTQGRAIGLLNTFPWDPQRLRSGNYIDAMALIRTDILRDRLTGYTLDKRLHGWEDYELWCRVAEAGMYGSFVSEIVARYRATAHSMLSVTNLSATEALSLIAEHHPGLFAESKVIER